MPDASTSVRNDMRCNKRCDDEKCCTCNNCMNWEGSEIDLYIEYVSVFGKSLVLSDQALTETGVYRIQHTYSEMTEIPSNICGWDNKSNLMEYYEEEFESIKKYFSNIVTINFEGNKIRNVPDINCLPRLDTLILRNNEIQFLSNTSISNLSNLRVIDFSGNFIQNMDPNTLTSPYLSLFFANFSHNDMTSLDFSNAMSLHPFCKIDYESNEITEITNEADFKLSLDQTYGPGFVNLKYNKISTFPDFKSILSLDSIAQLGTLLSFGFDLRGIPLVCDCNLHSFMTLAEDVIKILWLEYFDVKCTAPPELAGMNAINVTLDSLTCPVSADSGCQTPECTCVDKPDENTLVVDCSNSDLTEIPDIPFSKNSQYISLNVSGNNIKDLKNNSVLQKLSVLDISGNDLGKINIYEARMLENASYVDISDNPRLQNLPQAFQYHNVCLRNMEHLQITCNCEALWIEQWLNLSKKCINSKQLFKCVMPDNTIKPALNFAENDLVCYGTWTNYILETIILGILLALLIIAGTVVFIFRYEILILYLRARHKRRNVIVPSFKYDVFLSYNDGDEDVSKWVEKILEKNLIKTGYKVFRPNKDIDFGSERDSLIISVLATAKNFLVIMTDNYLQEANDMRSWTENEWKYGWNNFKTDRLKNIVLVNFDHLSSFDVIHSQIKAFLRVGCTVNFKNTDRKIMEEIYTKLGEPWKIPKSKFSAYGRYKVPGEAVELTDGSVEIDNISKFFPAEQYKEIMNVNDMLITETEMEKKPNKVDGMTDSLTDQELNAESRDSQTNEHTHQRHTVIQSCKFRKCYACKIKDERVNMPGNGSVDRPLEMFTLRPFSSQTYSSSTSRHSKTNKF
ncbi:uncharacterized protein LOC132731562 [Ruditapes philippinarum]|uniref:uncharacterized protein LOC132731562 n=1 Tax=Ruditapes philippinarum TaxID=129788 RepID=UPI00295BB184|nr:uncharacterized protein LOC132731562 [Ruditapes philippinarum]